MVLRMYVRVFFCAPCSFPVGSHPADSVVWFWLLVALPSLPGSRCCRDLRDLAEHLVGKGGIPGPVSRGREHRGVGLHRIVYILHKSEHFTQGQTFYTRGTFSTKANILHNQLRFYMKCCAFRACFKHILNKNEYAEMCKG